MQRIRQAYHDNQRRKDNVSKLSTSRRPSFALQQPLRTRNFGSRVSMSEERSQHVERLGSQVDPAVQ